MNIDVHAHYIPKSCLELWEPALDPGIHVGHMTDLGQRLSDMDAMGVDVQAISPWLGFLNSEPATARRINEGMMDAVNLHPNRFIGLAAVPMSSPLEAATELERAVNELGMRGVGIGTSVDGTNLDAKEFAPFYAMVQELDVPVFIHPVVALGGDRLLSYYLGNLMGFPSDTAVAAASLIFGGVLKEFPRLKFYLAHGGGSCPYLYGRWEHGWQVRPEPRAVIQELPSQYFNLLYFDSLLHSVSTLSYLITTVGADKVMLGTDYPYDMGDHSPLSAIDSLPGLSESEKAQIRGHNAAALFRLNT